MKKIILAIICLISMSICFTSCSEDEIQKSSIVGVWELLSVDGNKVNFYTTVSFAPNGVCLLGNMTYSYTVDNDMLGINYSENYRVGSSSQISHIKEELKDARGSYRQYLIDQLNELSRYEHYEIRINAYILSLNDSEMVLKVVLLVEGDYESNDIHTYRFMRQS